MAYGSPSGTAPTGSVIMLYLSTGHEAPPPKQPSKSGASHDNGRGNGGSHGR